MAATANKAGTNQAGLSFDKGPAVRREVLGALPAKME